MDRYLTAESIDSVFDQPLVMGSVIFNGVHFTSTTNGMRLTKQQNTVDVICAELGTTAQSTVTTGTSYTLGGTFSAPGFMTTAQLSDVMQMTEQGGRYMAVQNFASRPSAPLIFVPEQGSARDVLYFYKATANLTSSEIATGTEVRTLDFEFVIQNTQLHGYNGFNAHTEEAVSHTAFGYFGDFHTQNPYGLPVILTSTVPTITFNEKGIFINYGTPLHALRSQLPYLVMSMANRKSEFSPAVGELLPAGCTVQVTVPERAFASHEELYLYGAAGLFTHDNGQPSYPLPMVRVHYAEDEDDSQS
jgi:predicted cupin superfamily sugar epimerase